MALNVLGSASDLSQRIAHIAVVIFFVVSGFAIASSVERTKTSTSFFINRFSRIFSLAIPALLIALLLDTNFGDFSRQEYPHWQYEKWVYNVAINTAFMGELWGLTFRPFSIVPYWSLSYEVWYYLLFCATLVKKNHFRWLAIAMVLIVSGPRILLLLPCWLFGVALYRIKSRQDFTIPFAVNKLAASAFFLLAVAALLSLGIDGFLSAQSTEICKSMSSHTRFIKCEYSKWFLADFLLASLFFATCLLIKDKPAGSSVWMAFTSWLAPHTFGIYLLHYTLLLTAVSLMGVPQNALQIIAIILSALIGSVAISIVCQRTRPLWKKLLNYCFRKKLLVN
jgi:peptidoglycan/LPS O-acetylase OafA/YrhL